jgi:ketosteroid isomerase-like protein
MRWFQLILAVGLLVPGSLVAQDGAERGAREQGDETRAMQAAEKELLTNIRARLDAVGRNDVAAWQQYVADDMLAPLEAGMPSKRAWVREHESWPKQVKYWYGEVEDVKVRRHGDTAIVAFRAKQFNEVGGQTTYATRWQIETHIREDGRWKLVAVADCVIPREPEAVHVDPKVYDAYAGKYEWAPGMVSIVRREEDKLMEGWAGQGEHELLPESENTFFVKGEAASGDSSRVIFVKDERGTVTHFVYREWGLTDRVVKKVQ